MRNSTWSSSAPPNLTHSLLDLGGRPYSVYPMCLITKIRG